MEWYVFFTCLLYLGILWKLWKGEVLIMKYAGVMLNVHSVLNLVIHDSYWWTPIILFIFSNIGDNLAKSIPGPFVTYDANYRSDCARSDKLKTGWWMREEDDVSVLCDTLLECNLNGEYKPGGAGSRWKYDGIIWKNFRGEGGSMKKTEMRLF